MFNHNPQGSWLREWPKSRWWNCVQLCVSVGCHSNSRSGWLPSAIPFRTSRRNTLWVIYLLVGGWDHALPPPPNAPSLLSLHYPLHATLCHSQYNCLHREISPAASQDMIWIYVGTSHRSVALNDICSAFGGINGWLIAFRWLRDVIADRMVVRT
jgi:hypothetical protein